MLLVKSDKKATQITAAASGKTSYNGDNHLKNRKQTRTGAT